jgi:bifunctional non-homologous end joining protein LigD
VKLTKLALAQYYEQIADWILPHVVDRPLTVVRCPEGHQKKCFYQKHVTEQMQPAIDSVRIKEKSGQADYICIKNLAGVISLVQFGVLEMHPWGSRVDRYDRPDRLVFDLDPDPSVKFARTVAAARLLRDKLAAFELQSFVKTTGGKGLHVVVPLTRRNDWDEVRKFSELLARSIVREQPDSYVANIRKEKRKNRVLIDYLRNAQGATSVAAYSSRARDGAPVAVPLRWEELNDKLKPGSYTVASVPQRLSSLKSDPWLGFTELRQAITKVMLQDLQ